MAMLPTPVQCIWHTPYVFYLNAYACDLLLSLKIIMSSKDVLSAVSSTDADLVNSAIELHSSPTAKPGLLLLRYDQTYTLHRRHA